MQFPIKKFEIEGLEKKEYVSFYLNDLNEYLKNKGFTQNEIKSMVRQSIVPGHTVCSSVNPTISGETEKFKRFFEVLEEYNKISSKKKATVKAEIAEFVYFEDRKRYDDFMKKWE